MASATVDAFCKAMAKGDLEAVMPTVEAPWFQDDTGILQSMDELRSFARQLTTEISPAVEAPSLWLSRFTLLSFNVTTLVVPLTRHYGAARSDEG